MATTPAGDHSHNEDSLTVTPAKPSPTESVGCHPHGDHWHCDRPASIGAVVTSALSHDHEESATVTPTKPSPTESVGCHPHGDHWHCDGPRETGATTFTSAVGSSSSSSPTATPEDAPDAAGNIGVKLSAVVGLAVAVAAMQI